LPLTPGTRLGSYEILVPIGAGGMGEVYRARDTKLGREIALKVLPEVFAEDPERIGRFQREAQVLAALNHPHIAAIYGLEDAGGITALAMELVEGDDLAQRLARGPIPLDEALAIATQVAQALEAAHEQGIVHRDLKPANIKVRADGTAKVLDFGLAKLTESSGALSRSGTASMSPTLTSPVRMTAAGMILGTAAYMSPEQARGRAVDRRCDVWAFGCVLFEMLAGRRPFEGDDVSEVLAFVITKEPQWSALPAGTPASLRRLLRRCLEKDPRLRLRDIGDAILELNEAKAPDAAAGIAAPVQSQSIAQVWVKRLAAVTVVAFACVLTGVVAWRARPSPPAAPVTRFRLPLPADQQFTGTLGRMVAFSPDGAHLAYVANNRIYVRSMAENDARAVPATEAAIVRSRISFAWSPDGRFLAYVADGALKKIPLGGGAATTICTFEKRSDPESDVTAAESLTWSTAGLVFASEGRIMHVSADGGTPEQIAAIDEKTERVQDPQLLPDGRTLLFAVAKTTDILADRWDNADIVVQPARSASPAGRRIVLHGGSSPRYLPSGHLVYSVEGTLLAAPFDPARQQVTGPPAAVLEGVRRSLSTNFAQFSVADNGSLVYVPGAGGPSSARRNRLVTVASKGGEITRLPMPEGASYEFPRFSPDGTQVVFDTDDGRGADVWVYDLSRASAMRRLTFGGRNRHPIWSRDGRWITFQSDREGDLGLYRQRADGAGAPERLTRADPSTAHVPQSWSPAGDILLFTSNKGGALGAWTGAFNPGSTSTLFSLSLKDRKVEPFGGVQSQDRAVNAEFSPDGALVAYGTGMRPSTVYVRPFPLTGAIYQVSKNDDGHHPWWSSDGRELYYVPGPDGLVRVTVGRSPVVSFSDPFAVPRGGLIESPVTSRNIDLSPDGTRFIGVASGGPSVEPSGAPYMQVVLNWFEELKRLAPVR
jgi:serine/threonine-protein kinase